MPKNSESLNRTLFDLLHSKGYDPTLLDTSGKEIPTPEEAEVFQFDFTKDGENYGKVTMSIDGAHKLIIYFSDKVADSEKEESGSGDVSWYKLLNQLKRFAQSYQLSFELRNVDNLKHDMAKREYMKKKESIAEGYYPMGKKASYSDNVPNVKMVIQHSRQIEEGEQRYRNVERIFLENEQGERFLAPTTKPGIARVYARHIAEGGMPHDDRWNHIGSLVEEYNKMGAFVRATRNGQFNESAQQLVNEGVSHYQKLRESLGKLAGHRGYNAYFESYTPQLMEDEEQVDLSEMFMSSSLDPRIESVMPILAKLSKNLNEMSEVTELSEWADSLLEAPGAETLAHNEKTEAGNLKAFDLEEGGGGGNASEEPVQPIVGEAEGESLTSNNPQGIPESEEHSPVANAITRRILMQRSDLLKKYGPVAVTQAIDDVADFVGDVEEIGSSDVSAWIKQVERSLGAIEEGTTVKTKTGITHHGDYGTEFQPDDTRDEYGHRIAGAPHVAGAKQKGNTGAGRGRPKHSDNFSTDDLPSDAFGRTSGDIPKGKKGKVHTVGEEVDMGQYDAHKTVPSGKQDDDVFKRFREKVRQYGDELEQRQKEKPEQVDEDEFAGDYKTGPAGQWRNKGPKANKPAQVGDLVGANESVELSEMDKSQKGAPGWNISDDEPGGKEHYVKAAKPKDVVKKGADALNKAMDKAHKKPVKESIQLDEGVMDALSGVMDKIKSIPGIQKYIQMAQSKKAALINAAQSSRNAKELVANIQNAMGGQQAVAEGWGNKLAGTFLATAGGGLMATGAEVFFRAWNAMGQPDLSQMMNDPSRDGRIVLALVSMLVLVGAVALFGGAQKFKQERETPAPMSEGQEDLNAIKRLLGK